MKAIVQRVKYASVEVDGECVGKIDNGFLVLLGVKEGDSKSNVEYLVKKICNLRVFKDENDKMNINVRDIKGEILVVSQFTLYADCTGGNRPSFVNAAKPELANELYEYFKLLVKNELGDVQSGVFGANMQVSLLNDGPVTIELESCND